MKWLIPILLLAGCTNQSRVEQVPVEVEIPVAVPCIKPEQVPEEPQLGPVTRESSPGEKIAAVVYHREKLLIYSAELEALVSGCVD